MKSLATTEWLKIKKYRAFWWMSAFIALSYPGINYLFYQVYKQQLKDEKMGPIVQMIPNPFTFPDVWQTVAYLSSWFVFIPSVVVIMFITNEYTYKTHRQNIIDGWSRKQFMLSKILDVLFVTLLITILYTIVAIVIGYVNQKSGSDASIWSDSKYIGFFFLQSFSQLSLAFLLAFITRKAFIALGIFLFYYIILEPIIVGVGRDKWNDMGRFMPLEISDRLIPFPRFLIANEESWEKLVAQQTPHIFYTLIVVAITWGICFYVNSKRDL
jgi:ABC-type transport system involved in multi-copper enzyme maturation permease subunit